MIAKASKEFTREIHRNRIIELLNLCNIPITTNKNKDIDIYLDMCDKHMKIKRDEVSYFLYLAYESRFGQTKEYWQKIFDKS